MRRSATVSSLGIRLFVGAAEAAGLSARELLGAVGLDPAALLDPEARVPFELLPAIADEAARRTGDETFGLHAAERIEALAPGAHGVLDYVTRASGTLGEAIERFCRYHRLITLPSLDIALTVAGDEARLGATLAPGPPEALRQVTESFTATILLRGRTLLGRPLWPRAALFRHGPPRDAREHRRIFGEAVRFGAPANELRLEAALLAAPLPTADRELLAILDRHADELLGRLPAENELSAQVRRLLCEAMRGGEVRIEKVARAAAMSTRTLQRRLREEGTTFDEVLDTTRRELALRYLTISGTSIAETAFLLGFSEVAAFHRAFKRWTGRTPGEYRRTP